MQKLFFIIFFSGFFASCKNHDKVPDVSSIKIILETKRFEQDFFAMDTGNVAASMHAILKKYPAFTLDFMRNILGLDLDSLLMPDNPQQLAVKLFIHDYMPIKDSADALYKDFSKESADIKKALQFVKYYFPSYQLPAEVITFIGPINANFQTSFGTQGDVLTPEGLGIGLTLHLGGNFSFYKTPEGQEQYPDYLANTFDADHITVNSMRNIVDDLYPDKSEGLALIEQMVEKGKRLYLVTRFLPYKSEYIILGYTKEQWDDVNKNEAVLWQFFLNNELLNNNDQNIIKNYVGESPKTPELGEGAPGNLGSYAGLQIVKKFMDEKKDMPLNELMKLAPRELYSQSKYRPRN